MKLENFDKVRDLIKEREYYAKLLGMLGSATARLHIGNTAERDHDVRPELVKRMVPDMKLVIEQQIAIVDEALAALGVFVK
ncbi:hypothetical protein [Bradyrhizobium retamae]|uniref:Uncharacterized protein n=1 Tax=Bradyrhizobium retamae TaxID=1300035 RepID=A0A0R3MNS9_9BRAD|nr:hypothetical protein [Bradyrhizobium retamae]KRR21675.1 hypothetical protein CQ13_06390 [Bradyrhizobium retamae]